MSKATKRTTKTVDTLRKLAELRLPKKPPIANQLPKDAKQIERLLHELQVHQIELELQQNELIAARELAEKTSENYQALYHCAPVGYVSLQRAGQIKQANLTAANMLGASIEAIKGKRLGAYLTQDSIPIFNICIDNAFAGREQTACEIELNINEKVSTVLMQVNMSADGLECLTILTDISTNKELEVKLELAASVFTHAHEGIMITDKHGTILDINEMFTCITGFNREDAIGNNPRILKSGRQSASYYIEMWKALEEQGYWHSEVWNRRKNGEIYPEMQSICAVSDKAGVTNHYVSIFTDITESKAHQYQLEHSAHHDMLTGLPNRALLSNKLALAIKQSQRREKTLALAYLDLDGFKRINDTYGHCIGDNFLISLSKNLKQALRAGDFLARIGGDEFIAVLTDLNNESECIQVLQRMLLAASQNIICDDEVLKVSTSIGVTLYPQNGSDPDLLLRQADQAMYVAKDAGRNCYRFFDISIAEKSRTRRESLENIYSAFNKNEFELYYQPKINMKTCQVVGAEALIRWNHPEHGILPPDAFLPIMEGHSISVKIGEWVINTALQQLSIWQQKGISIPVSVNVGASQLQSENFIENLTQTLAAYPEVSAEQLVLEILETSALDDIEQVNELMYTCLKLGIKFALDDFGTGYSSLTYLKNLPVDVLKIDQTFVRDMLSDPSDLAIVKAVIGLAEIFNRGVIAEGVESKAHADKLLALNCTIAQGYGISRPMPAKDFPLWVKRWHHNPVWSA
ncbi:EAL domain-containing protein [Thalassotalea sp. PLHSN55]|uniref:sensor domain-containing protein n=1 Tax=Thalassotalea sp. PLHSN55 TaxID=3435888 RepID=UPI003F871A8D